MTDNPCCANCKHWNANPMTRENGYDAICEMTIYYGTAKHPGTTAMGHGEDRWGMTEAALLTRPNHYCSMHTPLGDADFAEIERRKRIDNLELWLGRFTVAKRELNQSGLMGLAVHMPVQEMNQLEGAYDTMIARIEGEIAALRAQAPKAAPQAEEPNVTEA